MKTHLHTPALLTIAGLALASSSATAATIFGTVEVASTSSPYNLTDLGSSTIGPSDWAYWNTTANPAPGAPTNRKDGALLVGNMSAVGGGDIRGAGSMTTGSYSFTDGTSPESGSGIQLSGLLNTSLGVVNRGVQFTITLPTTDTYEIQIFAPNFSNSGAATFQLTATIGSEIFSSSLVGGGNPSLTHLHTLTVTPDFADQVLTISNVIRNVGADSNGHARISAVTVSAIPEPSSAALVALFGLGLLTRRRR